MSQIASLDGGSSFQQVVGDQRKNVVVCFFAPWCGACKMMSPHFNKIASECPADRFVFYRLDVDTNKDLAKSHNIEVLPTFVVYRAGKIVYRQSGTVHEKLRNGLMQLS